MTTQAIVQDGFYREFICKAMALEVASLKEEEGGFADRRRKATYSVVEQGPGAIAENFDVNQLGNMYQIAKLHPIAAGAVAVVSSIIFLKNVASFIDYTGDQASYEKAMQVCLFATKEQLLTLNYLVSGSLLRFLQEAVITRFAGRIEALEKLATLSENAEIANRLPVYKSGMEEATALHALLTEIHQAIVELRNQGLKKAVEFTKEKKAEIVAANDLVELQYKAGLMTKDEYRSKRLETHKQHAINTGIKLGAHAVHKTVRLDDDGRDITYFVKEYFYGGAGNRPLEVVQENKAWFWKAAGLAILVCGIVVVGYYALANVLTNNEPAPANNPAPTIAAFQPAPVVNSSLEAKYK